MACLVNDTEIALCGDVGQFGWGDNYFTYQQVQTALWQICADHGADTAITVKINSGGGLCTEGAAIHAILSQHKGDVTVIVEGWAASAASLIAMAGKTIIMRAGSLMMIHDPSVMSWGTAADMRKCADVLDTTADGFVEIYAARSGTDRAAMRQIMIDEVWYSGDAAVQAGFADQAEGADQNNDPQAVAPVAFHQFASYRNMPTTLSALAATNQWGIRADAKAPRNQADQHPPEQGVISPHDKITSPHHVAADAVQVAQACAQAGYPELTACLLSASATMDVVTARIDEAREIQQVAATLKMDVTARRLIASGLDLTTARAVLFDVKAMVDGVGSIDPSHQGGTVGVDWAKAHGKK